MTQPDVTLTDYGLAIECSALALLLSRNYAGDRPLRTWFAVFFGALAAASFAGGTVHGFFLDHATLGHRILWPASLLAIGVATLAGWSVGARIGFAAKVARAITIAAAFAFAGYAVIGLFVVQSFWLAVLDYLPASAFLLAVFLRGYARDRAKPQLLGAIGLVLNFIAGRCSNLAYRCTRCILTTMPFTI